MDESDRRYFRQQLPALQFDSPFDFATCTSELQDFFRLYGFDRLVEKNTCQYYMGQVRLGGVYCVAHCWQPKNNLVPEQGQTIVIGHGLFDHSGLYLKLIENLLQADFTVFMPDFPGHGLSAGEPAAIYDFGEYADVIGDSVLLLTQQRERFGHISLLGQSTGAAAVLRYLLDQVYRSEIRKVILLAPLIRPRAYHRIRFTLPLVKLFGIKIKRRFTRNTNDSEFSEFLEQQDLLQPRFIPLSWLQAMMEWINWFDEKWKNITSGIDKKLSTPVLIVQGDSDETVEWRYNVPSIVDIFEHSTVYTLPEARHHLVNESKALRLRVFTPILKFLA